MKSILDHVKENEECKVLIFSFRTLGKGSLDALNNTEESRERFPNPIDLANWGECEIRELLKRLSKNTPGFKNMDSIVLTIWTRKLSSVSDMRKENFTNAHAVAEDFNAVRKRRETRLQNAWFSWAKDNHPVEGQDLPDHTFKENEVTLEDILGPENRKHKNDSPAWAEIKRLVGLKEVKDEIESMIDLVEFNYQSERRGQKPISFNHNRCFLGPPGVGKTTVAALYARLLNDLGILSSGHLIIKPASSLIGDVMGGSEASTTEALKDAQGGVLIIDDAHMLYQETSDGDGDSDSYRNGVIDTLVANISGNPLEDRCVILCGYGERMEKMFLKANPGLARRFPSDNALNFVGYSDNELCQILDHMMKNHEVQASNEALRVARG